MGVSDLKALRIGTTQNIWQTFQENMMTIFGMDKRSMALFRVFMGLTVIGDIINRWSDIRAHYTDEGFMPRFMVLQYFHNDSWITFHMAAGTTPFIAVLYFLHIVFAALYAVGYWTRLNAFLCWVWTLSLHNRNIFVLHGGDLYMRCVMFFALFLPVGDCYSVDNMLKNRKPYRLQKTLDYSYLHFAGVGVVVQMMCVYCTSYMHKTGAEWREIGTATWLALQLDYFRTPIGDFMLNFPELLKFLTTKVLWWEGFGVVFLFIPIFSGPIRTFGVFGFVAMHLGFVFALRLGQFGCCGTFGVLIMLPKWFWETIVFKRLRTPERLNFKVHYHPSCLYCNRIMGIITNFFLLPETQVVPILDSDHGRSFNDPHDSDDQRAPAFGYKKDEDEYAVHGGSRAHYRDSASAYVSGDEGRSLSPHSEFVVDVKPNRTLTHTQTGAWLLVQDFRGQYYTNMEAVIAVCKVSPLLWPFAHALKFPFIRRSTEFILNFLALNFHDLELHKERPTSARRVITAAESWRKERNKIIKQVFKYTMIIMTNIVACFFLFYVLSWNAGNVGYHQYSTPNNWRNLAYYLHLDQSWAMFSPRPPNVQWYYNIEGELDNGTKVELWGHEGMTRWELHPHTWDKPDPLWLSFKNHRWFKYYENGFNTARNNDQLRLNFGRYICREMNSRHHGGAMLHKFSIHWMSERVDPNTPNQRYSQPRQTLWNHLCYEKSGG